MSSERRSLRFLLSSRQREDLRKKFEGAIRKWVSVEVDEDFFSYGGGVSRAKVHNIGFKLDFSGTSMNSVNGRVVIKIDSKKSFELEQQTFKSFEDKKEVQKHFVSFASPSRQVNGEFFMIMELLENYKTFEEILYSTKTELVYEPCSAVLDTLEKIQIDYEGKTSAPALGILSSYYFGDVEKSVNRILEMKDERFNQLIFHEPPLLDVGDEPARRMSLVDCINRLSDKSEVLEPTFRTRMHGDCHPRNILFNSNCEPNVKLIDIDRSTTNGDYVYDYGELLADLEVFGYLNGIFHFALPANPYGYHLDLPAAVKTAVSEVENKVSEIAEEDRSNWESRLRLAKARYLLSMVPNFSPRDFSREFVTFIEGLKYMQDAVNAL